MKRVSSWVYCALVCVVSAAIGSAAFFLFLQHSTPAIIATSTPTTEPTIAPIGALLPDPLLGGFVGAACVLVFEVTEAGFSVVVWSTFP